MIDLTNFPEIKYSNQKQKINLISQELTGFVSDRDFLISKGSKISYFGITKAKNLGKLLELIFFGLNYNAKRIKHFRKPWVLDLQKSHKIKVEETTRNEISTRVFKRRVVFFSENSEKLTSLVNFLKKNRKQNSYSGHGLLTKNDHYKIKPGKIRQK